MQLQNYDMIRSEQKAAIFLMCMSEKTRKHCLTKLPSQEVKVVLKAVSRIPQVENQILEQFVAELRKKFNTGQPLVGGMDMTEKLLSDNFASSDIQNMLAEIRGSSGKNLWEQLNNINSSSLTKYLLDEYPQTVATVLSYLPPEKASNIVAQLPESFANHVMLSMLNRQPVQPHILKRIEETLYEQFINLPSDVGGRVDVTSKVADMVSMLDNNREKSFMSFLQNNDNEMAQQIHNLMFVFDDLKKMELKSVPAFLRQIDQQKLAMSLKGASEELKDIFLQNMSERARRIFLDEMDNIGPVRAKEVEEARNEILQAAKNMEEAGEIKFLSGDDDEYIE